MSEPAKDPAAVALGRKGKGKPKTRTPKAVAAWKSNIAKARAQRWKRKEETCHPKE